MPGTLVRIPHDAQLEIKARADARGITPGNLIVEWLEEHKRTEFWDAFRSSVDRAMADDATRAALKREQDVYDGTLLDGLEA